MKALVVYESFWGNTKVVAEAVAAGLGSAAVVDVTEAGDVRLDGLDLLVLGGPTHAFSMSRPSTRHDAHAQGASSGVEDRGIREWLDDIPASFTVPVATFDTRVSKVRHLPGSAARAAGKEVTRSHHGRVLDVRSFFVEGTAGPLCKGERERAAAWGAQLAASAAAARVTP